MSNYDLYAGEIVAFINGKWRHVTVAPGFVTLAEWLQPNEHLNVFSEAEAARLIEANNEGYLRIEASPIETSPHVAVGDIIQDVDILLRIAIVRFGRVPTGEQRYALIDAADMTRWFRILDDLDDSQGIDPLLDFCSPPHTGHYWNLSSPEKQRELVAEFAREYREKLAAEADDSG